MSSSFQSAGANQYGRSRAANSQSGADSQPEKAESGAIRQALLSACDKSTPGLENALSSLAFQFDGNVLGITFPHPYFAEYYRQNWQTLLERLARAAFGANIQFTYDAAAASGHGNSAPAQKADFFADFLVNAKSALAIAAIRNACAAANGMSWLLVTICGPSGAGKSTLLEACGAALAAALGAGSAQFLHGQYFQPPLPPETFWNRRRALILDDCQHVDPAELAAYLDAGKSAGAGRRAFCAFTGAAADISKLNGRIASRFRAGLVFELPQADLAMRLAYAEKRAASFSPASRRQLLQLARFAPDIPALAGLLQKMELYGRMTNQTLAPDELAKLTLPEQGGQAADWQRLVAKVAEATKIKPADILGASRKHDIAQARMVAMRLCRTRLGLSFPEIGRLFGGRNHATVIYAIRKVEELRQVDKVVHNLLTKLEA